MEQALTTLAAAWLADATHGLAAQLAALPVTGTRPAAPTIVHENTSGELARGRAPGNDAETAASRLLVSVLDDADLSVEFQTGVQDGTVTLALTVDGYDPDTEDGLHAARVILRAARASLMAFNRYRSEATGVADDVEWLDANRFRSGRREVSEADGRVGLDLLVTCTVRDYAAAD